jgi:hypothetical protein
MTAPTVISSGEITSLTALVREAARLDISVPKSVSDELKLHDRLTKHDPLKTRHELQQAHAALQAAPVNKVDASLEKLTEASLRMLTAQALTDTVSQVALIRLRSAVYAELDAWESEAVKLFNACTDAYKLNDVEVAGNLPDLVSVVSPIDLSHSQSHAVQVFREAVEHLHPLFSFYTRIATINGHEVGPGGADGLSTNLSLATRLGDPGSFSVARNAAEKFASIGANSDAARRYGQLAPFCIPAMCGYPLHLSTSAEAAAIRRAIQPQAA